MGKHSSNYVLQAKSKEFYWEGSGQLSIKTFSNGKAHYKTNKGFFAVHEERYLLLNSGPYTISIEEDQSVESFCLFFKDGFAEEVMRSLQDSPESLLDDPNKPSHTVEFFEKTYEMDLNFTKQLNHFKNHYSLVQGDLIWQEEQFYQLMQTIVNKHNKTINQLHSLTALKFSTREEMYRRISLAHEYIRACFDQTISLEDIAKTAGLSPNHLLRNYFEIFGKTPNQHVTEFRVQKAKRLLMNEEKSITDIAFDIGFNHPVSFSKMFKKYVGISPMQFRKKVILAKK
ncbi:hypothetical protein J6TS2_40430 [Heyndrickxia sporothermodurans]|nr:hypothetical protein J6TS2_40430 [Heyndrickxia sporothermodurans]